MREIIECPKCKKEFYDSWNLVCFGALNMCLLCANKMNISKNIFD
jgi:hypothetical protein